MTYERALWLPGVLKRAGLNVVEEPGWRTRGLSATRPFRVLALVWHHDASAIGDSPGVPSYMIRNFANAGAQIWVCAGCNGHHKSGTWHLVASGRAAHAGTVRSGMPDNETSLGIETDHTTNEKWDQELLTSLRVGTAAILKHIGKSTDALHFHKTICYPVGRKVDPAGLDLTEERQRVSQLMTTPAPEDDRPTVSLKRMQRAARWASWARALAPSMNREVKLVQDALKAEGVANYRQWQAKLGYKGTDANGIPGETSLRKLGNKHGFRVVG